ncbi:MAG: HAD-IA family hydrolase [Eubacteriales bacterium]|nr:HAD-IA family hydrolase [Eubacteriales bacterium]
MIKAAIFDIDNTLYNYDKSHVYGMEALAAYCRTSFGINREEMNFYYEKAQKIANTRIGTDTAAIHSRMIRFQCMTELLSAPIFPHVQNMYHSYWDTLIAHAEPSPGALHLFSVLKESHIRIGIGTDMTITIQYEKLKKLGYAPYIDFIVTSQETGVEKPHPHFFKICTEKAGCLPGECAFIGDNLKKDVQGAWDNGLCGIWYTQEKIPEKDMGFPTIVSFSDYCRLSDFLYLCSRSKETQ